MSMSMKKVCWPYFDPDFDNPERLYGPSCKVRIDNETIADSTVVKVDCVDRKDLLLEVVQVLSDLNLTISKSYISSDAGWFLDVFHVKDDRGNKLTDHKLINYIQQTIGTSRETSKTTDKYTSKVLENVHQTEHTAIEITGMDRPGLFYEISAALADLNCNIVEAHAWSHNARMACVAYVSDKSMDNPIDHQRLADIKDHLTAVVVKSGGIPGGEGSMSNVERRLHQLMVSVGDSDGALGTENEEGWKTCVSIESCEEKGYSMVSIECQDRPRLMFDVVCTLTDMQYVIFHASVSSHGGYSFQEYFIRQVRTEMEKDRVVKSLEAAIERRVCEGVRLELCAENRVGLLSDITRILRENDLAVVRADIATQGEKAFNAFYVKNVSGDEVDMDFVMNMKREMGPIHLSVKNDKTKPSCPGRSRFSIADMLKHNSIPIK